VVVLMVLLRGQGKAVMPSVDLNLLCSKLCMKCTRTYVETITILQSLLGKSEMPEKISGVDGTLGPCLLCMPTDFPASECTLVRFLFSISKLYVGFCILAGLHVRGSAGWSLLHAQYSTGKHFCKTFNYALSVAHVENSQSTHSTCFINFLVLGLLIESISLLFFLSACLTSIGTANRQSYC
jgi:hypothetical protein